jgi:hypothetical protein
MASSVIALRRIVLRLLADLITLVALAFRPRRSAPPKFWFSSVDWLYTRSVAIRPRRVDAATWISLALLSSLCDWRSWLTIVRAETVIRWHRAGLTPVLVPTQFACNKWRLKIEQWRGGEQPNC